MAILYYNISLPNRLLFIFSSPRLFASSIAVVVQNSYEVPLDTSAVELCNSSRQVDIFNQAEKLVLTPFALIYYLSIQALRQTFITPTSMRLGSDTDNRSYLEAKVFVRIIMLGLHSRTHNSEKVVKSVRAERWMIALVTLYTLFTK